MKIENIISQFSDHQGMKLIDFAEVALPVYRITSNVLVHQKVELDTIEEFILRSVNLGFNSVEKINEILGLSTEITKEGLTQLIRSDLIIEKTNGIVELTSQGKESVHNHSKVRPEEQQIIFDYDGLIRKVRLSKDSMYLAPKEVKTSGLIEIRSIPPRRPEEHEIEIQQVRDYIGSYGHSDTDKTLLRIRSITRAVRLFYKAVILIYKPQGRGSYVAEFCIENQLSETHTLDFINQDGLNRLNLLKGETDSSPKKITQKFQGYASLHDTSVKINYKKRRETSHIPDKKSNLIPSIHQYPKYLSDCLDNTETRLFIISPLLTSQVITHDFYKKILNLTKIGTIVHIGYNDDSSIVDRTAWDSLIELSKIENKLIIMKNKEIIENILIKDENYYIISNFDFLSYKGNIKKKFTDTWGNYVEDTEKVNKLSKDILMKYFS